MANSTRNQASLLGAVVRRAREQHLAQAAAGLTFTTTISMVPLLAVSFALFSRIAALRPAGEAIREQLLRALLPPDVARAVLKHLTQFAGNAGGVTALGFGLLLFSALALLLSVENSFNRIWQVKKPRSVLRRVCLYVVVLLTGPVAVGASLWATSFVLRASGSLAGPSRSGWWEQALNIGPVLLGAIGFSCLMRFVPHAPVRWRDAIAGGVLAAIAFELGKRGFAIYLAKVPTYNTIYGAFAPLLAFLVWVYYSWLVTLAGAVVSASLSRTGTRPARRLSRA